MNYETPFKLYGINGERKYLNQVERTKFYECAEKLPLPKRLFCQMMFYTGARISEISELSSRQIDFVDKSVIIRSLKKRRDDVYRQIPLPDHVLGALLVYIDVSRRDGLLNENHIWPFSNRTCSRIIKAIMIEAGIGGVKSSSLGLRHGFAVHTASTVPISLVMDLMGHASLTTTSIYLQVKGKEKREWMEKVW